MSNKATRRAAFPVLVTLLLLTQPIFAGKLKVAKDLEGLDPAAEIDVIVQFKSTPTQKQLDKVHAKGGKDKVKLDKIKAAAFTLPVSAIEDLADDPDVEYISPDRPVMNFQTTNAYFIPTVGADVAKNYGWDGKGIGVVVIDSGYSDQADLTGRIVYKTQFGVKDTIDHYGHGTHVAGIIGGNGSASKGLYRGVAPAANLIVFRVLDDYGKGTDSQVIAAIQKAIELKSTYNIRVINLSLGRPVFESYTTDPLCQAAEAAWKAGIVVVASAGNMGRNNGFGNRGYGTITAPGNDPLVITVGAMKTNGTAVRGDDTIASYSSKGPSPVDQIAKPDLVAPGNWIIAALGKGGHQLTNKFPANKVASNYVRLSGTSMSAPVVSGTVALMLQKTPSLTPDQVKARLMKTATKNFPATSIAIDPVTGQAFESQYDAFTIGAGYLDIPAALANTDLATRSAASPQVRIDPVTGQGYLVTGNSLLWGSSLLWGTNIIWGVNTTVNGTSLLWGSSLLWGTSVLWGTDSPWATSLLWGTATPEATTSEDILGGGEL